MGVGLEGDDGTPGQERRQRDRASHVPATGDDPVRPAAVQYPDRPRDGQQRHQDRAHIAQAQAASKPLQRDAVLRKALRRGEAGACASARGDERDLYRPLTQRFRDGERGHHVPTRPAGCDQYACRLFAVFVRHVGFGG